jgi:hypothetical protein
LNARDQTIKIVQEKLQIKSKQHVELFVRKNYLEPIQIVYEKVYSRVRLYYNSLPGAGEYNDIHKEKRRNIKKNHRAEIEKVYNQLVQDGDIPIKWRSEHALFKLIAGYFTDAIYQHYPEWLSPQSFDIFIPSLNIAFEYQGIQHFKPITFFGGEEAFKRRQVLDKSKKEKSTAYGVRIVEWHFEEPITKIILANKLNNIGILL